MNIIIEHKHQVLDIPTLFLQNKNQRIGWYSEVELDKFDMSILDQFGNPYHKWSSTLSKVHYFVKDRTYRINGMNFGFNTFSEDTMFRSVAILSSPINSFWKYQVSENKILIKDLYEAVDSMGFIKTLAWLRLNGVRIIEFTTSQEPHLETINGSPFEFFFIDYGFMRLDKVEFESDQYNIEPRLTTLEKFNHNNYLHYEFDTIHREWKHNGSDKRSKLSLLKKPPLLHF